MNEQELPGLEYWPEMPGAKRFQNWEDRPEYAEERDREEELMGEPRIYADLNGLAGNRVELTGMGTRRDLRRYGMILQEEMLVSFWTDSDHDDPLLFEGRVHFDQENRHWIALINLNSLRQLSDVKKDTA